MQKRVMKRMAEPDPGEKTEKEEISKFWGCKNPLSKSPTWVIGLSIADLS